MFSGFSFSAVLQANCRSYHSALFTYTSFQCQLINQIDDSLTSTLKIHKSTNTFSFPARCINAVWSCPFQNLPLVLVKPFFCGFGGLLRVLVMLKCKIPIHLKFVRFCTRIEWKSARFSHLCALPGGMVFFW